MFESKVGVEVEFFVANEKNELILPSGYVDTDDFPLLGEIRAEPGEDVVECYANFIKQQLAMKNQLPKSKNMVVEACRRVPLKLYRAALAACVVPKNQALSDIRNIYNTDIVDFSDQIIKDGKIQGINASCGVHLHFSCRNFRKDSIKESKYSHINIPLAVSAKNPAVEELFNSSLNVYKYEGYEETKEIAVSASMLNKPTIEWMVRKLDEALFKKYMEGVSITKYRQPGFFELKPYGFEYRSLPATEDVMRDLPEILAFCFDLLTEAKKYV